MGLVDGDSKKKTTVPMPDVLSMFGELLDVIAEYGDAKLIRNVWNGLPVHGLENRLTVDFVKALVSYDRQKELAEFLEVEWKENDWPEADYLETEDARELITLLLDYRTNLGTKVSKNYEKALFTILGALHDSAIDELLPDTPENVDIKKLLKGLAGAIKTDC
jgi:hypothetical protein